MVIQRVGWRSYAASPVVPTQTITPSLLNSLFGVWNGDASTTLCTFADGKIAADRDALFNGASVVSNRERYAAVSQYSMRITEFWRMPRYCKTSMPQKQTMDTKFFSNRQKSSFLDF